VRNPVIRALDRHDPRSNRIAVIVLAVTGLVYLLVRVAIGAS